MLGTTNTPAGSRWPANSVGAVSRRPTSMTTGLTRIVARGGSASCYLLVQHRVRGRLRLAEARPRAPGTEVTLREDGQGHERARLHEAGEHLAHALGCGSPRA